MAENVAELLALADKVEAYKPSGRYDLDAHCARELNEAIGLLCGVGHRMKIGDPALGNDRWVPTPLRPYVTSLDAAMTLVPERHRSDVSVGISPMSVDIGGRNWRAHVGGMRNRASATTPALALTAAALRARAATLTNDGGDNA